MKNIFIGSYTHFQSLHHGFMPVERDATLDFILLIPRSISSARITAIILYSIILYGTAAIIRDYYGQSVKPICPLLGILQEVLEPSLSRSTACLQWKRSMYIRPYFIISKRHNVQWSMFISQWNTCGTINLNFLEKSTFLLQLNIRRSKR